MATLKEMRTALTDAITSAIPSLKPYPRVTDVVQVPCIVVSPSAGNFAVALQRGGTSAPMSMGLNGLQEWEFEVYVLVGVPELGIAQDQLDEYVQGTGDKSIREAIFNNSDLGGVVEDAMVLTMDQYGGSYDVAKIPHVGACLKIKILCSGD